MNASPTSGLANTAVARGNQLKTSEDHDATYSNGELTGIITLLINELKEAHNAKMELVSMKIKGLEEQVAKLITQNAELKEKLHVNENNQQSPMTYASITSKSKISSPMTQKKDRGIRDHNIVFTIPRTDEENSKKVIEDILMSKFLKKPSINYIQKISKKITKPTEETHEEESEKYLVTFNSINEAKALYKERITALKNTKIYLAEDLTKEENYVFYLTRQLRKKKIIHSTWTENGEIYIIEKEGITPPRIVSGKNDPILNRYKEIQDETQLKNTSKEINTNKIQETEAINKEAEKKNTIRMKEDQMKIENIPTNTVKIDKSSKNEIEETGTYEDNGRPMSDAKPESFGSSCESSEEIERKKKKKKLKKTRKRSELKEKYDENESTQTTKITNMSSNENHINIINSKENCVYKKTQEEEEEESEVEEEEEEEDAEEEEKEELKKMIAAAISGIMTRNSKKKNQLQDPNKT